MPKDATVTAPYNFVPLNYRVCSAEEICSDLGGLPSHDAPQIVTQDHGDDGQLPLNGEISFDVICPAGVPILVGAADTEDNDARVFQMPDGIPVIPGSSIRGMIRNILEIASFGRMQFVEDQRSSIRDLQSTSRLDYGSRLARSFSDKVYAPRSLAGWLKINKGIIELTPCHFARIEHRDIDQFCTKSFSNKIKGLKNNNCPQDESGAEQISDLFVGSGGSTSRQSFCVENEIQEHQHSDRKKLCYRKAVHPGQPLPNSKIVSGRFVFTFHLMDRSHRLPAGLL